MPTKLGWYRPASRGSTRLFIPRIYDAPAAALCTIPPCARQRAAVANTIAHIADAARPGNSDGSHREPHLVLEDLVLEELPDHQQKSR